MAITVQQQPLLHSPAGNPLDFVVTSNNTAQPNFRYVCDLYITNVTPQYFRIYADKDPQFSSGHFDVHRIIENYVSGDVTYAGAGFQTNQESFREYQCVFGESYGPSSGVVVYPALSSGTVSYAWNAALGFTDFKNLAAQYIQDPGQAALFLTSQPQPAKIEFNAQYVYGWLYLIQKTTNNTVTKMTIRTYDSSNNLLQTVDVTNPFTTPVTVKNHKFLRFTSGTAQLNSIAASLITLGAQPIITTSVAKYTLQCYSGATATSAQFTYTISNPCSKDPGISGIPMRLHFLNALGGFDSFTFYASSSQDATINRSKFKKIQGGMSSASAYGYNMSDALDVNYDTNIKDRIHLVSGWISELESIWLEELATSPWVMLDDPTNGLVRVNVVNGSYERKKEFNSKVFNVEMDIEYTYNRYRQTL